MRVSIVVTKSGMFTETRLVQPEKAEPPIVVTVFGMVIDVRPVQSEKEFGFRCARVLLYRASR